MTRDRRDHVLAGAVVVGYDGSEPATAAVEWAAGEAATSGRGLAVLYAVDPAWFVPPPLAAEQWLSQDIVDVTQQVLSEGVIRAQKSHVGLDVQGLTVTDDARNALVQASHVAAVVVVGNRGHGALAGAWLGSVSVAVTAHAHCPVVVVRGDGSVHPGPERSVVVGVDGSAGADAAVHFAAERAAAARAPLEIVSVWQPGPNDARLWGLPVEHPVAMLRPFADAAAGPLVHAAEQIVRQQQPGVVVRSRVEVGSPGPALGAAAHDAGLLVVGSRGRGGFAGLLLGSVSRTAVHESVCPVAVVRG